MDLGFGVERFCGFSFEDLRALGLRTTGFRGKDLQVFVAEGDLAEFTASGLGCKGVSNQKRAYVYNMV